jgi:hypothetical protein
MIVIHCPAYNAVCDGCRFTLRIASDEGEQAIGKRTLTSEGMRWLTRCFDPVLETCRKNLGTVLAENFLYGSTSND